MVPIRPFLIGLLLGYVSWTVKAFGVPGYKTAARRGGRGHLLHASTLKPSKYGEDVQYYTADVPTLPPSSNQRITLTRYLNNVVKEQPEVRSSHLLFCLLGAPEQTHTYHIYSVDSSYAVLVVECADGLQDYIESGEPSWFGVRCDGSFDGKG